MAMRSLGKWRGLDPCVAVMCMQQERLGMHTHDTPSIMVAVVELQYVQAGVRMLDTCVGIVREPQAESAVIGEMHSDADMVTELECGADIFVGEAGTRKRRGADAGLKVITLAPSPAQKRCSAQLPGAAGAARPICVPIGDAQFANQIQAATFIESVCPQRGGFPCQFCALVMVTSTDSEADTRGLIELLCRKGRRHQQHRCQADPCACMQAKWSIHTLYASFLDKHIGLNMPGFEELPAPQTSEEALHRCLQHVKYFTARDSSLRCRLRWSCLQTTCR